MQINIQEIVNNKLKEMDENGIVKKTIEETIEKSVLGAVTDALSGYKLKRQIEELVTEQVSIVAKNIGFTAYNSFIAQKLKQITEEVLSEDISTKLQNTMDNIFLMKHENLKLSEILNTYRDYMRKTVDTSEQYDLNGRFHAEFTESSYGTKIIRLSKEKTTYRNESEIEMWFYNHPKSNKAYISTLCLNGKNMSNTFKIGNLYNYEALLVNLLYNKTEFEFDIEDEDDIDTSFGIDI